MGFEKKKKKQLKKNYQFFVTLNDCLICIFEGRGGPILYLFTTLPSYSKFQQKI
jgi:hypothetical protein